MEWVIKVQNRLDVEEPCLLHDLLCKVLRGWQVVRGVRLKEPQYVAKCLWIPIQENTQSAVLNPVPHAVDQSVDDTVLVRQEHIDWHHVLLSSKNVQLQHQGPMRQQLSQTLLDSHEPLFALCNTLLSPGATFFGEQWHTRHQHVEHGPKVSRHHMVMRERRCMVVVLINTLIEVHFCLLPLAATPPSHCRSFQLATAMRYGGDGRRTKKQ